MSPLPATSSDTGAATPSRPGLHASEEPPVVHVEQATLAYGRRTVLSQVSLDIRSGEFWCLLGANGEGKTTFIKALLGAIRPRRGRIQLRADFHQRTRIGFVPQEAELNPAAPTTVEEFLRSGLVGIRLRSDQIEHRCQTVLKLLGIAPLRQRSLWALSGGQRQRALVARALIRDPLLLIVDEPTAGLDLAAAAGLLEIITDLCRRRGITVIFVTHDLQLAADRASHAALFKGGRLVGGPLDTVFTPELLQQTFGVPVAVERDPLGRLHVRPMPHRVPDAAASTDPESPPGLAPLPLPSATL